MFGKKTQKSQIDKDQLELIENAQRRVKQKKRLYIHFVVFLIGAVFLVLANTVLGIGDAVRFFNIDWFVFAIFIWLFFFLYHAFNVFVTHKFMGDAWEKALLDKLVGEQKLRIEKLKHQVEKEAPQQVKIAPSNTALSPNNNTNNLTIIVAASENNAIGKDNGLIWHLSDDLKRFKSLTSGHHIIMGRKTFESFPKPLPNRTHVIVTRQDNYPVPVGVIVVNSIEKAIEISKNDNQPFIIGGGEIYKQALPYVNTIEITRVHDTFDADTFFPEIDTTAWKETHHIFHGKDSNNNHDFTFLTYIKR
ncbi:dihydrofolate reductase [Bizionia gelidisalsuginis]|uniref:dihydrofolate reductase n=1 Tax=Bizionia gelidisalsuginis TaxID=291188 RepID=A0ABY3M759_9FLAO|nr:dihydrofolate reductase [Bizionia gelidisalsuginis]TYC08474.1 dihydrofolate reductase [Bizionia gelidisalsuginis]